MRYPVREIRYKDNDYVLKTEIERWAPSLNLNVRRLLLQRHLCRLLRKRETTRLRDDAIKRRFAALQRKRRLLMSDCDDPATSPPIARGSCADAFVCKTTNISRIAYPDCRASGDIAILRRNSDKCTVGLFTVATPWGNANGRLPHDKFCKRLTGLCTVNVDPRLCALASKRHVGMPDAAARRSLETVGTRFAERLCSTPKVSMRRCNASCDNSLTPQRLGNFARTKHVRRVAHLNKMDARRTLGRINSAARPYPQTRIENGFKHTWC